MRSPTRPATQRAAIDVAACANRATLARYAAGPTRANGTKVTMIPAATVVAAKTAAGRRSVGWPIAARRRVGSSLPGQRPGKPGTTAMAAMAAAPAPTDTAVYPT
jgi:hypothetical protein